MQCAWLIDAISVPPLVKFVFHRERPPSAANFQLSLYHRIFFKKMQFLPKSCTISSCCVFVRPPAAVPVPQRSGSAALVNKTTLNRCFTHFSLAARRRRGRAGAISFCRFTKNNGCICGLCTLFGPRRTARGIRSQPSDFLLSPRPVHKKTPPRAQGAGGVENPDAIAGGGR